ncbi:MAG: NADH:ubiquinone reductase (Na(+)-transporting) subunit C [Alloprevotella sp.]|jgi:NADH:ubiquinone oxidoreductase, Na(+)-translocating, C subunit|nr:MAG: NADH:ubiquinone reductase (Na(+)-transporting) subunit C [Alloprevotella sp.]
MKFNTNSNVYTIVYASVMVIIAAFLLAFVASVLKSPQEANVANDKRGQILSSLNIRNVNDVTDEYNKVILHDLILDANGQVIKEDGGFEVESKDITAKNPADKKLPLYVAKVNNDTIYVVPLYGRGLWGGISGYLALKKDFDTVFGSYFTHESETAGLGARIVEEEFQEKFIGKKAFSDSTFQKVALVLSKKIENPEHEVDAITGATLTSNGVSEMFQTSLLPYQKFFSANHK